MWLSVAYSSLFVTLSIKVECIFFTYWTKETIIIFFSINQRDADFLCLMLRIIVLNRVEAVQDSLLMFIVLEEKERPL